MNYHQFTYHQPFPLENGEVLPQIKLAYHTWGQLNEQKSNVVWIFHALTANSNPAEWWDGLIGPSKLIDPEKHFIVCVNMLGSCYGSSHALDVNPSNNEFYYHNFPTCSIRDMVHSYQLLKDYLGIKEIYLGIGGSMGGQQLLEWSVMYPHQIQRMVLLATNAQHSQWGIAFNESQRWAIEQDPTWKNNDPNAGLEGLKIARSIALLSYRNYPMYQRTFMPNEGKNGSTYQRHQGNKLANRFNAFSYHALTRAMDQHHIGRDRGTIEDVLSSIPTKTLVIGISSDILFPPSEQEFIAEHIPEAELAIISSNYGHDGFLLEYEKITTLVQQFLLKKNFKHNKQTNYVNR